jgi:hypothetical protein
VFLQDALDGRSRSTANVNTATNRFPRSGQEIALDVALDLLHRDLLFASSLASSNVVPYTDERSVAGPYNIKHYNISIPDMKHAPQILCDGPLGPSAASASLCQL